MQTLAVAAWRHQNRDALNEAHVLFDFFFVPFFFAMALLLVVDPQKSGPT